MKIKNILNDIGIKYKEIRFLKNPQYPYIVYNDSQNHRGSDVSTSSLIDHSVSLDLYTEDTIDENYFDKVEMSLYKEGIEFTRSREWVEELNCFMTTYEFETTEKRKLVQINE